MFWLFFDHYKCVYLTFRDTIYVLRSPPQTKKTPAGPKPPRLERLAKYRYFHVRLKIYRVTAKRWVQFLKIEPIYGRVAFLPPKWRSHTKWSLFCRQNGGLIQKGGFFAAKKGGQPFEAVFLSPKRGSQKKRWLFCRQKGALRKKGGFFAAKKGLSEKKGPFLPPKRGSKAKWWLFENKKDAAG
ncbi:MAG: hypothetical protein H6632_20675 [Anaerolineales bacterium]|nr:hypothetical protein [Anaerolineales bacterium]